MDHVYKLRDAVAQFHLFQEQGRIREVKPYKNQLLKWIGNKQRFAHEIIAHFPAEIDTYYEPFLGSAGVLGTLEPDKGVGSDSFGPLIRIWQTLKASPDTLKEWYSSRWHQMSNGNKVEVYEAIKASYNLCPNPADLLFIARSCYGGVVRFRQSDGYISTPCGIHNPIPPSSFSKRVDEWYKRTRGTTFLHAEYEEVMDEAKFGDLVYCDPPYTFSQSILYGAQVFSLAHLFEVIDRCKRRGVRVAVSIDGTKRSGNLVCDVAMPDGLFERELFVNIGRSMLKRFQMNGKSLEGEVVADRLLLTY
jgi:DNA adenine methylase